MSQDSYNAKFLTPEEVASSFIFIRKLTTLLENGHALIMGPRGCGKTTLLKMLTRNALKKWITQNNNLKDSVFLPDYYAIYIPSDSRWTEELKEVLNPELKDKKIYEKIQRFFVTTSIISEWVNVLEDLIPASEIKIDIYKKLINTFELSGTAPIYSDIKNSLNNLTLKVSGIVNSFTQEDIEKELNQIPIIFFSSVTMACEYFISLYNHYPFDKKKKYEKWALCFDELEISPEWLQKELLQALRSTGNIYLKLTWSPILPSTPLPETNDDYKIIRLWYSHMEDAIDFCENLAERTIKKRLVDDRATPLKLLGRSVISESTDYSEGKSSSVSSAFLNLYEIDPSFKNYLLKKNIDIESLFSASTNEKDKLIRKMKPLVMLRECFGFEDNRRTRKFAHLYCGIDVLYGMSEGNPRRLRNLIDSLIRDGLPNDWRKRLDKGTPLIPQHLQAKILSAESHEFSMRIKTIPMYSAEGVNIRDLSLFSLIDIIGNHFKDIFLSSPFSIDYPGSFYPTASTDNNIIKLVKIGLERGAFIYIGGSKEDVCRDIVNSRFRLSYIFSPKYRLLLRNYSEKSLDDCLKSNNSAKQLTMELEVSDENKNS